MHLLEQMFENLIRTLGLRISESTIKQWPINVFKLSDECMLSDSSCGTAGPFMFFCLFCFCFLKPRERNGGGGGGGGGGM